jgi:hypothetical protein
MRLSYICFIAGASAGLAGMGLGLFMGIAQDFTLTPVHAHTNLLGFVALMLYGLYYRGAPRLGHLAWVQLTMAILGVPAMAIGLALELTRPEMAGAFVAVIAGSLLTIASLGLFLVTLIHDSLARRAA